MRPRQAELPFPLTEARPLAGIRQNVNRGSEQICSLQAFIMGIMASAITITITLTPRSEHFILYRNPVAQQGRV